MDGKRTSDRVQEIERKNQPKFDRAKERVAQDDARLAQKARAQDDEIQQRALEAGTSPDTTVSPPELLQLKGSIMRNRNTHPSDSRDRGGSGDSTTKRATKQTTRKTSSRGEHRGRSSGSSSRRRSGSKSNAS